VKRSSHAFWRGHPRISAGASHVSRRRGGEIQDDFGPADAERRGRAMPRNPPMTTATDLHDPRARGNIRWTTATFDFRGSGRGDRRPMTVDSTRRDAVPADQPKTTRHSVCAFGPRLDPAAATAKLNAYRAEKGLNPLRLDPTLTAMAERQAQAMAQSGTMSHDVDGSLSARLAASGINAPTGENLGRRLHDFDEALAGWRASAGHNGNLLMSGATRFGIAFARNPRAGYGVYWAMEVGAEPRSGGAPEAVWLFPLPIVLIRPQ
jgi:hypothetical protein